MGLEPTPQSNKAHPLNPNSVLPCLSLLSLSLTHTHINPTRPALYSPVSLSQPHATATRGLPPLSAIIARAAIPSLSPHRPRSSVYGDVLLLLASSSSPPASSSASLLSPCFPFARAQTRACCPPLPPRTCAIPHRLSPLSPCSSHLISSPRFIPPPGTSQPATTPSSSAFRFSTLV